MNELRQIAVVSGKGGTGKTMVTASLSVLAASGGLEIVLVDGDVDTPNLHVFFRGKSVATEPVSGVPIAGIHAGKPAKASRWEEVCAFGAIRGVEVDPLRCVGCRVCEISADPGGVRMLPRTAGVIVHEEIPSGPFLRARLSPGEPGFGGLVYRLRAGAEEIALEREIDLLIVDAPAGLGCPVIASLAGCSLALLVAEPTLSGYHDFSRICGLCELLGVRMIACLNRCDVDLSIASRIEELCHDRSIPVAARIPFDESVMRALDEGRPVVEAYPSSAASTGIRSIAGAIGLLGETPGEEA